MKLIITQPEIEAIVRAHVENTVQLREGSDMKIDFTATRSEDGITATIDIPYLGVAAIPAITGGAPSPIAAASGGQAKPASPRQRVNKASPVPPTTTEDVQEATDAAQETTEAAEGTTAAPETSEASQGAQEAAEGVTEAPARGPSLFSGAFRQ